MTTRWMRASTYNKLIELIDEPIAIDEIVTYEERVSISPM